MRLTQFVPAGAKRAQTALCALLCVCFQGCFAGSASSQGVSEDMHYEIKNIKIDIPSPVREILHTLNDAGFEAYIVGGCVRDSILGVQPKDWDITTQALPYQVKSLFKSTVDTGIEHGTVMVIKYGEGYEVTTFRIDGKYLDGRHPESVAFTPSLQEDLKRRDFTINAFAYSPESGVTDLFGGISDLNNSVIRCVGKPEERFGEDALRMMRAVRFCAQLGFDIEEKTAGAIAKLAPKLAQVSTERIRAEFEKTLCSKNPAYVNLYKKYHLAPYIFPQVYEKCFGKDEAAVFALLEETDEQAMKYLRLAAFFDKLSYEEAKKTFKSFTYDNRTADVVSCIIKFRDVYVKEDPASVKRAMRDERAEIFTLTQKLNIARAGAAGEDASHFERLLEISDGIERRREPYLVSHLALSGSDLIEAGIPRGVRIGKELNRLLDLVIEKPELNTEKKLLELIK